MSAPVSISILTITRNNLSGLRRTLDSVFAQNQAPQEIIVIDGASNDGSIEFLSSLGCKIYWKSEQDSGISDAFNKALKLSNSEWVIFLNAGDEFANEDVIERMNKILQNTPDQVGVCSGNARYVDHLGVTQKEIVSSSKDLMKYCSIAHQASFIRRELHLTVPFDVRLSNGMDYDVWLRLLGKTEFVCFDSIIATCEWGGVSTHLDSAIHSILLGESIRWFNHSRYRKLGIRDVAIIFLRCLYVTIKLAIIGLICKIKIGV